MRTWWQIFFMIKTDCSYKVWTFIIFTHHNRLICTIQLFFLQYRAYADRMQCIVKCDFFSSLFIISFSMVDYPIFVRTSHPSTILPVEVALCLTGYFRSVKCEHNSVKKGALTLFGWYFLSIPTTRWQHIYTCVHMASIPHSSLFWVEVKNSKFHFQQ